MFVRKFGQYCEVVKGMEFSVCIWDYSSSVHRLCSA